MAKPKLGRPRLSRYPYCVLAINVRTDLRKAIKKRAKQEGVSTSEWARETLREALKPGVKRW